MRSPPEFRGSRVLAMLAMTAMLAAAPLQAAPPVTGTVPSDEQIAAAVRALKQDPNLGGEHKERTLAWTHDQRHQAQHHSVWIDWIAGFFVWLARTSRFLFWGAIVVLAGLLAIFVVRVLRQRAGPAAGGRFTPPTHVRDLDIRPESLPADIGAAARELWQRGQQRAALALLYRGLISRLVHVYGIPIRSSSTEGECLALAAPRLQESSRRFASLLVLIWQQSVYGGREPPADTVFSLCDEFAHALSPQAPAATGAAA